MQVDDAHLEVITCSFPTPEHPCYHVWLRADVPAGRDFSVERVEVNGEWTRDFWVYDDAGYSSETRGYFVGGTMYNPLLPSGHPIIVVRHDWQNGSTNHVRIQAVADDDTALDLSADFTAPDRGGYWNSDWEHYAGLVLTENQGLDRTAEPVHATLGLYADQLEAPEREVRVVSIDPESGVHREVPCQVYDPSTWDAFSDEHCQPTTTLDVAFLADVPAHTSKVYLVFYGNPDAPAPDYATDLRVSGEGLAQTIENEHYLVRLHPKSGAIDEILLKQGVNALFDHHLETNGALHWNPGVYAPPRTWIHASDWDPPENHVTQSGPVFCMTKRWGPLPMYPEVTCSITYLFYAHNPHIMITSTIDVLEDIDVVALRNGEIVLNHNVVREFAWKKPTDEIGSVVIKERPRHPTRGLDIEADTPWFAFYNRERLAALGAINIELSNMRRDRGLARVSPYMYMHWGPWTYCARPLLYTFATNNPQRVYRAHSGSTHYEKMAFLPFKLGTTDSVRFRAIERRRQTLTDPLDVHEFLPTDERVPTEWVPPILVDEFEEV